MKPLKKAAAVAQSVEHVLGKDGVIGSTPISSSSYKFVATFRIQLTGFRVQ